MRKAHTITSPTYPFISRASDVMMIVWEYLGIASIELITATTPNYYYDLNKRRPSVPTSDIRLPSHSSRFSPQVDPWRIQKYLRKVD
ncbi:hypothetical protein AG1IA_05839 [Rhizoctonia solani AG-1 IA]|uniref:Uncharacterized protein n=1 Tax=Thanatephorus cucumeris (strain AG1-IA) TaxID=983506 RepID=L8WPP2_THACA|nr:hypothetical protein AG1IA_05839 [Rhizoctonia solani AG-1 IA]